MWSAKCNIANDRRLQVATEYGKEITSGLCELTCQGKFVTSIGPDVRFHITGSAIPCFIFIQYSSHLHDWNERYPSPIVHVRTQSYYVKQRNSGKVMWKSAPGLVTVACIRWIEHPPNLAVVSLPTTAQNVSCLREIEAPCGSPFDPRSGSPPLLWGLLLPG